MVLMQFIILPSILVRSSLLYPGLHSTVVFAWRLPKIPPLRCLLKLTLAILCAGMIPGSVPGLHVLSQPRNITSLALDVTFETEVCN